MAPSRTFAEPFFDDTSHNTCNAFKNSSRSVSVSVPISRRTYFTHIDVCRVRMVEMSCTPSYCSSTVSVYCPAYRAQ